MEGLEGNKMLKKDIINEIKRKQKPVIIYGINVIAKVLLSICKDEGVIVDCFCDGSPKKAKTIFCNMEVMFTSDVKLKYQDPIFIIAATSINDVAMFLEDLGFSNWYSGGILAKGFDISNFQFDDISPANAKYAIDVAISCHENYMNPGKLFLRSVDLIITEKCSLKCKDCSNLMQYYENPKDCELNLLFNSIRAFCAVIDEVLEFRLIGGDVWMNKKWPLVVKRLQEESKVKKIVLFTNGTILPKKQDLPVLKDDRIRLVITDYGFDLSRKLKELIKLLTDNHIMFQVSTMPGWFDCASITPHNRTIEEQKSLYKICCAKNMLTLSDGKLYSCPYAANATRLSAVPDNKNDYVVLFQDIAEGIEPLETKKNVIDYIKRKEYLETCDYCSGRPVYAPEIPPAIQVDKPLKYRKY